MTRTYFFNLAGLAFAAFVLLPVAWGESPVKISDPWVRATVSGQKVAGAYMEIVSQRDAALVAAASPVAGVVEIHTMKMEGDVMRMRAVERIVLPAGKPVQLAPGGYHVMLMDLKQELKPGSTVPITLTIAVEGKERATVQVTAPVREGPGHHHHQPGH